MNEDDVFHVSIKGTHLNLEMDIHNHDDFEAYMGIVAQKVHDWYHTRHKIIKAISKPIDHMAELNKRLQQFGLPGMVIDPNQPMPEDLPEELKEHLFNSGMFQRPKGPATILDMIRGGKDAHANAGTEVEEPSTSPKGPFKRRESDDRERQESSGKEQSEHNQEVGATPGDDPHRNNPSRSCNPEGDER